MKILSIFVLFMFNSSAYESVKIDTHGESYENNAFGSGKSSFASGAFSRATLQDINQSKQKTQPLKKRLEK
jgi:hypothetical protein